MIWKCLQTLENLKLYYFNCFFQLEAYNLFNTAEVNLFWPVTSKPASFSWHLNMKFSKKVLTIGDQFVFYERYNFAKQSLYLHLHWLILYKNLYNFFQISPQVSRFRSSSVSFLSFFNFTIYRSFNGWLTFGLQATSILLLQLLCSLKKSWTITFGHIGRM